MRIKQVRRESGSNEYGIEDDYFNSKIKKKLKRREGYLKNDAYDQSPEYEDLQLVLDLLKQSGAKPLFISVPVKVLGTITLDSRKNAAKRTIRKFMSKLRKLVIQLPTSQTMNMINTS